MKFTMHIAALVAALTISHGLLAATPANPGTLAEAQHADSLRPHYQTISVDGHKIFYREAGDPANPTILLLHGTPGSSFAYRDLIPLLADRYHVIAPDLPGFGYSDAPPPSQYKYTFDHLASTMDHFMEALKLQKYVLYVCDYGAAVGYRLALLHPERVSAIISQNGNAYEVGISTKDWTPVVEAWEHPSPAHRAAVRNFTSHEMTKYQWVGGVKDTSLISPDTYTLSDYVQDKGDDREIQTDLLTNFATERQYYPKYQAYFRKYQPPLLAVWGKDDPFFSPLAAEAYKRDLPKAEVHLYDASHFALETSVNEIAWEIRDFLGRNLSATNSAP